MSSDSFTFDLTNIAARVLDHPEKLLSRLNDDHINSWPLFASWLPTDLLPGTRLKLNLLKACPEIRARLFTLNHNIFQYKFNLPIRHHLAPATWRSYSSVITKYLHWHWSQFPHIPALPASASSVRHFVTNTSGHSYYLAALKKIHHILELPVLFDDDLTHAINKGQHLLHHDCARDKAFLKLHQLNDLVQIAQLDNHHIFAACVILGYAFSLRLPSELLNPENRFISVTPSSCTITLRKRKNERRPTRLRRKCKCSTWGAHLCPVRAARLLLTSTSTLTPSTFNNLLKRFASQTTISNPSSFSSHSLRRGRTDDLFHLNVPPQCLDASGGWRNPRTRFYYIDRSHNLSQM